MAILYSAVATSPKTILCSHQTSNGNFEDVANAMLPNIPTKNDGKTTYTSDNFLYHVVVENGIVYMCAADSAYGRRQPYSFLEELRKQFNAADLPTRAHFATAGELNPDFKRNMTNLMEQYAKPGGGDQFSQLQRQVDEVKGVMTQNIEKVLERGERLDDLMDKTDNLEAHSHSFKKTARSVHKKMWWKNTKMTICIVVTVLIVLLVLILIILFSTGVLPPKGGGDSGTTTTTTTVSPL